MRKYITGANEMEGASQCVQAMLTYWFNCGLNYVHIHTYTYARASEVEPFCIVDNTLAKKRCPH